VALSLGSPPPGVTRHRRSVEPGLSSPAIARGGGRPILWPTAVLGLRTRLAKRRRAALMAQPFRKSLMRLSLALLLIATLAGCSTVRESLGAFQRTADKGVGINPSIASEGAAPAKGDKKAQLPSGLGGDKANAAHSAPPG
jgi:hypothetical protein